jgi:hypothetical protein
MHHRHLKDNGTLTTDVAPATIFSIDKSALFPRALHLFNVN